MRKEQIAVIALAAWLTIISIFMLLAQTFDIKIFLLLSIISFLIMLKLITPKYISPGYTRYTRYIIAAGIVLFGVIVALKVMEILDLEIGFLWNLHNCVLIYVHPGICVIGRLVSMCENLPAGTKNDRFSIYFSKNKIKSSNLFWSNHGYYCECKSNRHWYNSQFFMKDIIIPKPTLWIRFIRIWIN